MKRWQGFLLVFVLMVGIGGGIAYMEADKTTPTRFAEDCVAHCKPRPGVIERLGPNIGPDWRPTSHNVVCTCK